LAAALDGRLFDGGRLATGAGTTVIDRSASKRSYRDRIRNRVHDSVGIVHLAGSMGPISSHMGKGRGHVMPASLLESQFATLEQPGGDEAALTIGLDLPLPETIED
ncbi:MAG: hypothetical protein ABW055_04645, partial [Pararhizobium sp.]